eukprot:s1628_g1.t3
MILIIFSSCSHHFLIIFSSFSPFFHDDSPEKSDEICRFCSSDPWFLWRPVATPCLFLSVMAEETMPHVMPALLSGTQLSHLQAQETLGTAQLREAVKCPPSVDEETWIASQMKEIFLEVVRMVHFLTSFCDDTTCPRMCAGDAEYKWAEVDGSVSWMPAARYMSRLIEDVDQRLIDESLIPTDGSPMPRHLRPELETMLRRLFRVYAHAYIHHFRTIQDCGAEAHVNCSFKHFLFFVLEFQLVRMDEMLPLAGGAAQRKDSSENLLETCCREATRSSRKVIQSRRR